VTTVVGRYVVAVFAAGVLAGSLTAAAPPASAGCQPFLGAQLCDGPIQPDGTWQRCETQTLAEDYTKGECFPLGNNHFLPPFQPAGHIDP